MVIEASLSACQRAVTEFASYFSLTSPRSKNKAAPRSSLEIFSPVYTGSVHPAVGRERVLRVLGRLPGTESGMGLRAGHYAAAEQPPSAFSRRDCHRRRPPIAASVPLGRFPWPAGQVVPR